MYVQVRPIARPRWRVGTGHPNLVFVWTVTMTGNESHEYSVTETLEIMLLPDLGMQMVIGPAQPYC